MKHYAVIGVLAVLLAMAGCSAPAQETSASNAPEAAETSSAEASSSEAAESSDAEASVMEASSSVAEGGSQESSAVAAQEGNQEDSNLFTTEEWPRDEITADVPVPSFSVQPSAVKTSDSQDSIKYENVPAAEVEAYIQQVKNAGFTFNVMESKEAKRYMYTADNLEDYTPDSTNFGLDYSKDGQLHIFITR